MSKDRQNINISGSTIQGVISNIGGSQTFQQSMTITMGNISSTVGSMNTPENEKEALRELIAKLEAAFEQVPTAQQADAEKIAKRVKDAVEEVSAEKPDHEVVEAKVNLLKKAAENVREVMPIVAEIAINIATHLLKTRL